MRTYLAIVALVGCIATAGVIVEQGCHTKPPGSDFDLTVSHSFARVDASEKPRSVYLPADQDLHHSMIIEGGAITVVKVDTSPNTVTVYYGGRVVAVLDHRGDEVSLIYPTPAAPAMKIPTPVAQ